MNLIDIIVLSIVGITGLIGLKNGLVKSLIRLLGGLFAVVLAYFLCGSAVELVSGLVVVEDLPLNLYVAKIIEADISKNFVGIPGFEDIFVSVPDGGYTFENVSASLTANGVPAVLSGVIAPVLVGLMEGSDVALATYASGALAGIIMSAVCFLLIFFIISVLLGQLTKLLDKVFSLPVIGLVNRLGGFLFGVIKSVLIIWVILFFATLLGAVSGPTGALIESTTVVKFLADNNPLTLIVANGFDFEKTVSDLIAGMVN